MGLYAAVDFIGDWGCPEQLEGGDESIGFTSVFVDYSTACEIFVETFLSVANSLVPVDTGYLMGSIDASTDGVSFCEAEATADYAQYVEYGTVHMDAQPYFEPALEAACQAAGIEAQAAIDVAQELLEMALEAMMEAAMAAMGGSFSPTGMGGMSFGAWLGGLALFALMFIITFPILLVGYAIADMIFNSGKDNYGADSFIPEVIIT